MIKKFLLTLIVFFGISCSINLEKEFQKIENKSKEAILTNDKESIAEYFEELDKLQEQETKDKIFFLAKVQDGNQSIFFLNPSLTYFVFNSGDKIYFYYKNKLHEYQSPQPTEIHSSYFGKYVIMRFKNGSVCKNAYIKLDIEVVKENQEKLSFNLLHEFNDSCEPIVLTDTGKVYTYNAKGIFEVLLSTDTRFLVIPSTAIKKKFKKNEPRIFLYPLPYKGFWIFYGLGGNYDLYYFDEKNLKLLFSGAASYKIFYSVPHLFDNENKVNHVYFIYTGAVGEYSFTGFELPDQVWKSFNIPVKQTYTFVSEENQFLYLEENRLYLLNPNNFKETQLPMNIDQYFILRDQIVFLSNGNLYVRKERFSPLEKKIFALKEELEYHLR